ncbi:uncharacterized protein LOC110986500 isoform X2 [Acanthaster planci]|uniref:Uncharacterized protein LOC110986500 isoform X2 n=1 Tax=Acanthaster planci TaxID=133434 RepID=A0A8B7ZGV4_ACAPL|nr:uncharacterized protein LOC110986500 isoform X2 [Acanthaster planci]
MTERGVTDLGKKEQSKMAAKVFFVIFALAVLTAFVMAEYNDDFEGFEDDALVEMVKRGKKAAYHHCIDKYGNPCLCNRKGVPKVCQ